VNFITVSDCDCSVKRLVLTWHNQDGSINLVGVVAVDNGTLKATPGPGISSSNVPSYYNDIIAKATLDPSRTCKIAEAICW